MMTDTYNGMVGYQLAQTPFQQPQPAQDVPPPWVAPPVATVISPAMDEIIEISNNYQEFSGMEH